MKKWLLGGVLIIVCAAGAYWFWPSPSHTTGVDKAVQTAQALPPVVASDNVVANAKVVPVTHASLGFATSGIVAEVDVKAGDTVNAGQVLVRLVDAHQTAALAGAEAQLQSAKAQLAELKAGPRPAQVSEAQAELAVAQAQLDKIKLSGAQVDITIAQANVQKAQAALDLTKAGSTPEAIAAAEAQVAVAQASVKGAQATLADTVLKAPFAGVVGAVNVTQGEFTTPSSAAVELADPSEWQIETDDLTELNVVHVHVGDTAKVTVDALPDLKLSGRVTRIQPFGESKNGDIDYTVVIQPDTQDKRLRWNMTAAVTITPQAGS